MKQTMKRQRNQQRVINVSAKGSVVLTTTAIAVSILLHHIDITSAFTTITAQKTMSRNLLLHANSNQDNRAKTSKSKFNKDSDVADNEFASDITNEWGIPYSKTLTPLHISRRPVDQLPNGGKVTLVGSGPGDPDLLTMSAYKLLTDVPKNNEPQKLIISDRLVSNEILNLIDQDNDNVELKVARKLPGCQNLAQEEIYYWIYKGLAEGKHVIRLKIGDPFIFGRGGEEILQIRKYASLEPKVIPGVSAAFSAPLLGSIPVTHRGISNQVVMCTGYGRDNTSPDLIQYHKEQTIVFLMAVGRLRTLCERLVTLANYPPLTPVGIVENAGCPNQRTVVGNLQTISDIADKYEIKPPATMCKSLSFNIYVHIVPTLMFWLRCRLYTLIKSQFTLPDHAFSK